MPVDDEPPWCLRGRPSRRNRILGQNP